MSNKWEKDSDDNNGSGIKLISFQSQVHKNDDDLANVQNTNQYGERKTLYEQLLESKELKKRELEAKSKPSTFFKIFLKINININNLILTITLVFKSPFERAF